MPKRLPPLHRPPRIEIVYPRRQSADSGPTNAALDVPPRSGRSRKARALTTREPQLESAARSRSYPVAHSDEYRRQPSGAFTVGSQDQGGV